MRKKRKRDTDDDTEHDGELNDKDVDTHLKKEFEKSLRKWKSKGLSIEYWILHLFKTEKIHLFQKILKYFDIFIYM